MTDVAMETSGFDPEGDITGAAKKPSRIELLIERVNLWWQNREEWHRLLIQAGAVAILIGAVGTLYLMIGSTSSPVNVAASFNEDAASKSQEGINLLRKAFEQQNQQVVEVRNAYNSLATQTNANTNDIKSIKAAQQGNPKVLEGYQIDIEAIKKLMAEPPVKLIPMSAIETVFKAA